MAKILFATHLNCMISNIILQTAFKNKAMKWEEKKKKKVTGINVLCHDDVFNF